MSEQSLDEFLAGLAATYNVPDRPIVTKKEKEEPSYVSAAGDVVILPSKAAPKKGVRKAKEVAKPKAAQVLPDNLPKMGIYSAEEFLNVLHNAGRRVNQDGKAFFDAREERNDQIRAIAGFCGYDPNRDFGEQDMMARQKAHSVKLKREGEIPEYKRTLVAPTIAGYVAGMPNHKGKQLQNLQARERAAVEEIARLSTMLQDESKNERDKAITQTLIRVEEERLKSIRTDISGLFQG